jgi:TonB-linked SusC/RagA family outer membrane protein
MDYTTRTQNSSQGLFGDVYIQVEPIKGLKFRSSIGLNYNSDQSHGYLPVYHLSIYSFNDTARVAQAMGSGRTIQFDNLLSYDFKVAGAHSFSVMAGSSSLKSKGSNMYGSNWGLRVSDINFAYLSVAQNRTVANYMSLTGEPYESALMSYFGRLQYNFREKYLLNLTFRADGSSRFAQGHRWGYFPSVSTGWVASSEDFMRNITWLDYLKVRASWGQVGNQNVSPYQYLSTISFSNAGYIFGPTEGQSTPGAYPNRIGNPNLKWETSQQTNIGFDATVMKRLNVSVDYYIKDTKNWLISTPMLGTSGVDSILINGGDVRNTGVELALNYHNNIGKLNYSVGVNGAWNKNRIGNIPTNDHIIHGNTNVLYSNASEFYRAYNGEPVGYFWGLKTAGIFQSEQEINSYVGKTGTKIQPGAQPGDVRYVDLNNDGVIDAADKTNIGDPNPHLTYGFSIALDYKGFDFLVQASGVAGNKIVQSWRDQSGSQGNYSAAMLERWHGPGSSNKMPRVTEDNRNWTQFSDLYIHDGDFLRISTITLGYDFSNLVKKNYLSKVRVYASVLNAFTFTNYNGMDPEVGYNEGFSSGVDLGYYPRPRTVMVGANIRF